MNEKIQKINHWKCKAFLMCSEIKGFLTFLVFIKISFMNNKKGLMSTITDMWGWLILFMGLIFWVMVFMLFRHNITYEINEEAAYLKDGSQLLTFLMTPVGDGNLADSIADAYEAGDNTILKSELNNILNKIYGRAKPVCWKLWHYKGDDKKLLAEEDCKNKQDIFDARTTIPLHDSGVLNIRLSVVGYKE